MAQGLDTRPGSVTLNALLAGPVTHANFLDRETADGKVPSPAAPPSACDDSQASDDTPDKKIDPDWEGSGSETEVSDSESESDSESDGSSSESDDEESEGEEGDDLVNGHSEQSADVKFVPEFVNSTEESGQTASSEEVCSQLVSDLLREVVPSPKDGAQCSSESTDGRTDTTSTVPVKTEEPSQDSVDKSLERVPDFLDLIDAYDAESSQDVKSQKSERTVSSEPAPIADENQGKKKKKRKRKREEVGDGEGRKRKRKENSEGKRRKREPGEKRRKKSKKEDGDKIVKSHERKNIRKIITDDNLDEETRTAQQLELERKKRLQEFQRNAQNNVHLKALLQSSDEDDEKPDEEKGAKARRQTVSKSKDVVTISSSDDDDVVMLDESKKSAPESDSDDDPNDAGCHVNDLVNIPDDQGKVLVNVGHPKEDPDIFVNERLAHALKPHQIGGIRFLYDNLVESLNHFKASNGFGCILAHSMGLGKTIQIVTFIDIFLRQTNAKYVLCIVPINTLQNWVNEFNMWLPMDPSKVPQPPPPKQKAEKKEEKQKQEKNDFDPFSMNFMNYPWMNSGFNQQPMNNQMGNWNCYGYGNGQWDPMGSGKMNSGPMMSPMNQNSHMGSNQNPFQNFGPQQQQYPPVKQEFGYGQPDYQQSGYGYGQCASGYGQYGQDAYGMNYGMNNSNHYMSQYGKEPMYSMNGPTAEMPKFPPLTPPPESNSSTGCMSSCPTSSNNLITSNSEAGMGSSVSVGSGQPMGTANPCMGPNPPLGTNQCVGSNQPLGTNQPMNASQPMVTCQDLNSNQPMGSNQLIVPSSQTMGSGPPMNTSQPMNQSGGTGPPMGNVASRSSSTSADTNVTSSGSIVTVKTEPSAPVTVKIEPGIKTEIKTEPLSELDGAEDVKKEADTEAVKKEGERETAIDPELANTPWRPFEVYVLSDNHKNMTARSKVVGEWKKTGGVLLMGYEMYRLLATRKPRKRPPRKADSKKVIDVDQEDKDNELAIDIQAALLKPGPDLIICDEGHRIKNSHAGISQALKNIKTRRRVVLTGYPLQNNLLEYWCMVDFVRPNFLGSKTEFSNMFERPIMNGQCHDSTATDCKLMRYRAHVLHSLLEGFVQRRGHTVLRAALPPKTEYVVLVKMSPIQRKLYNTFMQRVNDADVAEWATANPIKAFSVMCKIWNHPDILYKIVKRLKDGNEDDDLDIADENSKTEEQDGAPKKRAKKPRSRKKVESPEEGAEEKEVPETKGNVGNTITYDWAQEIMADYQTGSLQNGGKMLCMFSIMEESIAIGEKILIFSQSLFTLNLIEEFLSQSYVPVPGCEEKWTKNRHYFRLDGSTSATDREKMVNNFNNPDNQMAWLFLLSTRAGCLGINLTGANRVIVYDASWNPCHDCQAVCRVYRYGQTRPCFIYRLVSDNTMEKKIYDRQVSKQTISDRVVDELNPQHKMSKKQMEDLLHHEDVDQPTLTVTDELLDKYEDPVVQSLLRNNGDIITKEPFTHESLLIDRKDYRLSKAEKNIARLSYEREKKMSAYGGYTRPSYANYYPKVGTSNSLITGLPGSSLVINRSLSTPLPRVGTAKPVDGKAGGSTGVTVHQIVTTTDIVVPGSGKDPKSQYKIPAGQQVLVIKTPRGVYIRTPEGKIFAVRTTGKLGNETGLPGLGTPVTGGAGTSAPLATAGTPLVSSASVAQKSLLTKVGGALPTTTTPRILGSVRRRAIATPNIRLTTPRPGMAAPLRVVTPAAQQSVITLDDSDSETNEDGAKSEAKSDGEKPAVPAAPSNAERKRVGGQISLIKPIGGLNDPPPQSVKVIMKPPVSRQNSASSEGAKSPRGEMTSILRKSPMGSPASARSPATISSDSNEDDAGRDRTITLVRPPLKKPAVRTQIFLARSSDESEETKDGKLTLVTKPSAVTTASPSTAVTSCTTSSVAVTSAPSVTSAPPSGQGSCLSDLLMASDQRTTGAAATTTQTQASLPPQTMTELLSAPTTVASNDQKQPQPAPVKTNISVPAFSQPYKSNSQISNQSMSVNTVSASVPATSMAPPTASSAAPPTGNNMAPMSSRTSSSGGMMTEGGQKMKPMNWMVSSDNNPTSSCGSSSTSQQMPLSSFSGMSQPQPPRNEAKNPLEGMMAMSGFSNTWSNPYSTPVPASQPLPPWPAMDANTQFADKKRRDPFAATYPQPDYRYNNYQPMDYFQGASPYYPQQNQYPSYQNYARTYNSAPYYPNQNAMYAGHTSGTDFQPRYGHSMTNIPNSLESMPTSFDSGSGGDANTLKWHTAFTHPNPTTSANSAPYPSQRSSVPDLPDLSSLGDF